MADVGEERGLGAINLHQGFGPLALLLGGSCVGHPGGYSRCQQIVEGAVSLVQRQSGADAGYEDDNWPLATGRRDRQRQGLLLRFRVFATR